MGFIILFGSIIIGYVITLWIFWCGVKYIIAPILDFFESVCNGSIFSHEKELER